MMIFPILLAFSLFPRLSCAAELEDLEGVYDPTRDNRGRWAEQEGVATLDTLISFAADLRTHAESHGKKPRVFLFAPSINVKSGGIKVLYKLVHDLNMHGANASIMYTHPNFPRADWIDASWNTPIISGEAWGNIELGRDSILILPEGQDWVDFGFLYKQANRNGAICGRIALSFAYLYKRSNDRNFSSDGTDFVLCNNDYTANLISRKMGTNTVLLPTFINSALYHDNPSIRTCDRIVVAYVTRKSNSGIKVQNALAPLFPGVEWIPMGQLPEQEYAESLRRTHVYIATGKLEAQNLVVMEAWASGALTVGFHGHGGSLMMIGEGDKQNSVMVPNGDDNALIAAVREVLEHLTVNCTRYSHVVQNAHKKLEELTTNEKLAAQFVTDLLTAYRFGFPFPSDHFWATSANTNKASMEMEQDVTVSALISAVLVAWGAFYLCNTRRTATKPKKHRAPAALLKKKQL